MKKINLFILVIALLVLLFVSQVHAFPVMSTFDSNDEGWTSINNGIGAVIWNASGGNPDGHIRLLDKTDGWGYVQAPAPFLVDADYGSAFTFDLMVVNSDPITYPNVYNVRTALVGDGFTLINELTPPPSTVLWQNYNFALNETASAGWRSFSDLSQNYSIGAPLVTQAQFIGVLQNLTGVFIAADYSDGYTDAGPGIVDETWIDHVILSAEVPEPGTVVLFGIGLTGLIMYNVRRKKTKVTT